MCDEDVAVSEKLNTDDNEFLRWQDLVDPWDVLLPRRLLVVESGLAGVQASCFKEECLAFNLFS